MILILFFKCFIINVISTVSLVQLDSLPATDSNCRSKVNIT